MLTLWDAVALYKIDGLIGQEIKFIDNRFNSFKLTRGWIVSIETYEYGFVDSILNAIVELEDLNDCWITKHTIIQFPADFGNFPHLRRVVPVLGWLKGKR